MEKIKWGVMSTARIGVDKVIPAMQQGEYCEIYAIASRDPAKAENTARSLGISNSYGSYTGLLNDPEISAIYIPLPNHLHLEWSLRALEAGKHVLCEKPIAMNHNEARMLMQKSMEFPDLKIMEAFMYRFHPQWAKVRQFISDDRIGEMRSIQVEFNYFNDDPENIRNIPEFGGGGLMDIGCYCISVCRFLLGKEPDRVIGLLNMDESFKTDILASGILQFGDIHCQISCSTQALRSQSLVIKGTKGAITLDLPFTPDPDVEVRILIDSHDDKETIVIPPANQYTLQGDLFSRSIIQNTSVPTPFEDAIANMRVIDAIKESSRTGSHISL